MPALENIEYGLYVSSRLETLAGEGAMSLPTQARDDANAETRLAQARTLAFAGFVGPVWFTALVVVQGLMLPDYSHVRSPISALGAGPTGWIQNLNFYVAGALLIAFAVALQRAVQPTRRGVVGIALLMMSGIGVALDGVFPWVMIDGIPTETPPHVVGATITFAAAGLGLLVFSRRLATDSRWRDLATYTMYSGIAVLVLFVAVGFFAIDEGTPLHPWAGLLQRVLCAVWFVWMIVLAVRLRSGLPTTA